MVIGGISGSGPACTAAVERVMLGAMMRAGYAPGFAASVTAAAGSTDILIPPSVAFIIYSVLVPSATVPALFVAGIVPGIIACIALVIPAFLLSLYHDFGSAQGKEPEPRFWQSFKEAFWALMAPVLILGGMRISIFMIFLPLFVPVAESFSWDLVWFGVLMTYNIALGQFTPPMAVNLMVSCRLAGCSIESTIRWDAWLLMSMFAGLLLIILFPALAI